MFFILLIRILFSISPKCGNGALVLTRYDTFKESQYEGCTGYTSLTLQDGINTIPARAFYGCTGFKGELILPLSLECIEEYAFYGCTGFTGSLTFQLNVQSIGKYAFYGCTGFSGSWECKKYMNTINEYAFYGCSGFKGILLLSSYVDEICDYAFAECSGFESISSVSGLLKIGKYAFANCTGAKGELSLNSINEGTFYGCTGIEKVTFSYLIESISPYSFYGCTNLSKILFSSKNKNIGEYSFYGCTKLKGTLELPSEIQSIGDLAFGETNYDVIKINSKNPNNIQCSNNIFTNDVDLSINNYDGNSLCGVKIPEKTPTKIPLQTPMPTISRSPYPNSNSGIKEKKVDLPTIIVPSCIGGIVVIGIIVFLIIHYRDRCGGDNSANEYDPRVIEDLSQNPKNSKYERPLEETENPRNIGDISFL